jgi:2-dehydropantoate 2-reductase
MIEPDMPDSAVPSAASAPAFRPIAPGPVLVMGAGAIGLWLGGRLAAAGVPVRFVGRPRVLDPLRAGGLVGTDLDGGRAEITALALAPGLHERVPSSAEGSPPALVLLCVKSGATAAAAAELAAALPAGTPVISMQNGLHNAEVAQAAAPGLPVLAGMVPYNVVQLAPTHVHRGSDGELAVQDDAVTRRWDAVFAAAGLPWRRHADMRAVQWSKLLLNLNNPVNALSGLPLKAQLLDPDLRRCTAMLMREAVALLRATRTPLAKLTPLPPAAVPGVLSLPTPLFRVLAARLLRIDDRARSSMADDLALGRTTEVRALCGEVVRLAMENGNRAPLNARMIELVEQWPSRGHPWTGPELRQALRAAAATRPVTRSFARRHDPRSTDS